jgi:hypothetical protein
MRKSWKAILQKPGPWSQFIFKCRPIFQTVTGVTGAGRSADIFEGTPTQPTRTPIRGETCVPPLFRIFGRPRYAMMSRCPPKRCNGNIPSLLRCVR